MDHETVSWKRSAQLGLSNSKSCSDPFDCFFLMDESIFKTSEQGTTSKAHLEVPKTFTAYLIFESLIQQTHSISDPSDVLDFFLNLQQARRVHVSLLPPARLIMSGEEVESLFIVYYLFQHRRRDLSHARSLSSSNPAHASSRVIQLVVPSRPAYRPHHRLPASQWGHLLLCFFVIFTKLSRRLSVFVQGKWCYAKCQSSASFLIF